MCEKIKSGKLFSFSFFHANGPNNFFHAFPDSEVSLRCWYRSGANILSEIDANVCEVHTN